MRGRDEIYKRNVKGHGKQKDMFQPISNHQETIEKRGETIYGIMNVNIL